MKISVLKPGLLVSLKTSVYGGVHYQRRDLDPEHVTDDGMIKARWETDKTVEDAAEFERASKTRSECRSMIARVCIPSAFGLLCPLDREKDLVQAMDQACVLADQHNATAERSFVSVYTLTGRIASDDVEAAKAIGSEVKDMLDQMESSIKAADPAAIRTAANTARKLAGMLSPETAGRVSAAIEQARAAAREIVKRVGNAGEVAARVVAECKIDAIQSARFAFLDLEEPTPAEPEGPAIPSVDLPPAPSPDFDLH